MPSSPASGTIESDTSVAAKIDVESEAYQRCLSQVRAGRFLFQNAPYELRSNKAFVLEVVKRRGIKLMHVSEPLKDDKEVVLAAVKSDPQAMRHASTHLQNDGGFVLQAVETTPEVYRFAANRVKTDPEIRSLYYLWIARIGGCHLEEIPPELLADKKFVLRAIRQNSWEILKYASASLKDDRTIITEAIKVHGLAIQHASDALRKDKDVVLLAVTNNADALKFAMGDLTRDADCLIVAGLWDESYCNEILNSQDKKQTRKIALSTRFSLKQESSYDATNFTAMFKQHRFIRDGNFEVYSPNAFDKSTCDPSSNYTDLDWPCRGTIDTCQKDKSLKTGHPTDDCCWRYSFRCKLDQATESGGFMLQIVEQEHNTKPQDLGDRQKIEKEMAQEIGTKIFRVHRPQSTFGPWDMSFRTDHIEKVVEDVKKWYAGGCSDMSECSIHFPSY